MKPSWNNIGSIIASEKRFKILIRLNEGPCTPTHLVRELNLRKSDVSTTLKELIKLKCVKNLTPKKHKGKIFEITPEGKQILKQIHLMTNVKN